MSGPADFRRLASEFKKAGAKGLASRINAALQKSGRPAIDAARESAASTLPRGGGRGSRRTRLARTGTVDVGGRTFVTRRRVATSKMKAPESIAQRVSGASFVVKAISGKNPRVRITATGKGKKKIDLDALDKGVVRHPLFGNRRHWYQQSVAPEWFTRPMEAQGPKVLENLEQAIDEIQHDITG